MGHVLTGSRFTRNDAPLSVRRAYTVPELERLLAASGLRPVARFRGWFGHRWAIAAVRRRTAAVTTADRDRAGRRRAGRGRRARGLGGCDPAGAGRSRGGRPRALAGLPLARRRRVHEPGLDGGPPTPRADRRRARPSRPARPGDACRDATRRRVPPDLRRRRVAPRPGGEPRSGAARSGAPATRPRGGHRGANRRHGDCGSDGPGSWRRTDGRRPRADGRGGAARASARGADRHRRRRDPLRGRPVAGCRSPAAVRRSGRHHVPPRRSRRRRAPRRPDGRPARRVRRDRPGAT